MNKLLLSLFLSILAVVAVAAQDKTDDFIGTWKLTKSDPQEKARTLTVKVERSGEFLVFTKTWTDSATGKTDVRTTKFDGRGDGRYSQTNGMLGGTLSETMRVLGKGKLVFSSAVKNSYGTSGTSENWTLSKDGKTLSVRTEYSMSPTEGASYGGAPSYFTFVRQ